MKNMKKILSILLALNLVLGMAPQLTLTARAADASEFLITPPTLNKTTIYFNGQEQSDFITPGVAKEGYEIRYSLSGMIFYVPGDLSMRYPDYKMVSYAVYRQGAQLSEGRVSEYIDLGWVTMHRAIPEYATRPAAKNADSASWEGVPLVTAGTTNLPDYFAVEYKVGTGNWSKEIPTTMLPGTFTVQYRLAALKDRFAITQIQSKSADELLDLSNRQEGSVQVTIGKPATVTAPVANTSLIYSGQNQQLLARPAVSDVGSIQYSVTDASATAPGDWSVNMPAAKNAGDYKVWYKTSFIGLDDVLRYFAGEPAFVTVSIGQKTPAVDSWPSASVFVGDTLDSSHLTGGSASVAGTFSVGAGQSWNTAGTQTAGAVFTPADTVNYAAVTGSVAVNVNKRMPSHVEEQTGITMPYGTTRDALGLPSTVDLVTEDGKTYTVPVTWSSYDPEPGQLGTQTLQGTLDLSGIDNAVYKPDEDMSAFIQVTLTNRSPGQVTYGDKTVPYTGEVISHELEPLPEGVSSVSYSYTGEHTIPGTYPVTVTFTMKEFYDQLEPASAKLSITNAQLENVTVAQNGTLTYNGQPQTPEVNASASSQGGQEVTFTYSTAPEGPYGDLPSFEKAGTYTVYYKASAQYHDDATGSFDVTINKQEVTPPTIAGKVYNGQKQTADITTSDLYTVTKNDGGTEGGEYIVQLMLNYPTNYCWPAGAGVIGGENGGFLTLKFTITATDNAWVTEPTIADWTYGVAPSAPAMGEPVYGKETTCVSYVGTTNAGVAYESTEAPTEAGDYRAVFTVPATSSYGVLTKEVPFTVNRAALPADRFDYSEPGLTYNGLERSVTVNTILEGVDPEDITLNYFANGNDPATPRDAGFYTFTVSVAQSDNYEAANLTSDDWKFTINKAEPVISWDVTEFTYNTRPQGEATVTLENNETYNGTIQYTYGENVEGLPTDAGTYTVTASIEEQANYYAVSSSPTTIVIKPKEVTPTVVLTPDTFYYDGEAKHPVVKVMDGETVIPDTEYTVTWGDARNVGPANAWIMEKAGGNYTIAQNTKGVFLILPDTSALEGVTTENVNSSHQAAIDEIQAAMDGKNISEASEAAQKQWNDLLALCTALEAKISDAKTGSDAITAGIAALPEQPTTDDLHDIQEMLDQYAAIEENLTDAEKEALKDEIEKLEALEEAIEDTNSDLKEITDGTGALNKDDLDYADKAAIADLQKKIDDLEDDPYLTDTQKQTLEDAEEKLAELEAEFAEADEVTEQLNKLPATANPDAKTAVEAYEAAKKAYEDLGEDKSKVAPAAVKKLEALKKELTDYKITKGNGAKWAKGSSDGLSFTANGYFPHFKGVKIDGVLIDSSNYTAKSGSTIVTLNASYLQKLKTGKHTITVCFGDSDFTGEASGEFKVITNNGNPFTGDNSNILLWSVVAVISLLCLATMLWFIFRKKGKHQR